MKAEMLGSAAFRARHGTRLAYMSGSMAFGIASEALALAMSRAGLLASFGAAGLELDRVKAAIAAMRVAIPPARLCVNLIHSPDQPERERQLVDLLLAEGVSVVEASAFMQPTEALVLYRARGARLASSGAEAARRVIAKVSRREVAEWFLRPPPARMLAELTRQGALSADEARAAALSPLADDITVEADSAGHTDNQSLVCAFPAILALRGEVAREFPAAAAVGIGAAGGLGTPAALAAAFAMGADYAVTGSINQACVESGASDVARGMLARAEPQDVAMAPAADMFEIGARVQVLKRGTMFGPRAQFLGELYRRVGDLDALTPAERKRVETQILGASIDEVWAMTEAFWRKRDPAVLAAAAADPKRRMSLVVRWYLGLSTHWALDGAADRALDYQIWCGPAMGAFNAWARGGAFESPASRSAPAIAQALMDGAAALLGRFGEPSAASATALATDAPPSEYPREPGDFKAWLIAEVARQFKTPTREIDPTRRFEQLESEHAAKLDLLPPIERKLGRKLSPTLLWNHPDIDSLSNRLSPADAG